MKNNRLNAFLAVQVISWLASVSAIAQNWHSASDRLITKKNFYMVTVVEQNPKVKRMLPRIDFDSRQLKSYLFNIDAVTKLDSQLILVYNLHKSQIDELLDKKVRPSGYYNIYAQQPNKQLWLKCWNQYFSGINYIISGYGIKGKVRYPNIDSASYKIQSAEYQSMISNMLTNIKDKASEPSVFYELPLRAALGLLRLNGRDEASRLEPLEKKENCAAKKQIARTYFSKFGFSALVIPGEGPEQYGVKLSDGGKARCKLAAEWYTKGKAPFIIVSGGYCHPFKTEYCEAFEMKYHLMNVYGIPENAIIMDPHARHTTTNFRNACRYLLEYGFPVSKPALLLTTKDQADYIADQRFELRNKRELGYVPYRNLKRLSDLEFSFYPVSEALFRDPLDPLDP